jgi:hypothetical protein
MDPPLASGKEAEAWCPSRGFADESATTGGADVGTGGGGRIAASCPQLTDRPSLTSPLQPVREEALGDGSPPNGAALVEWGMQPFTFPCMSGRNVVLCASLLHRMKHPIS